MAPYQVTRDGEILQQLFVRDDGLARLVEQVVNQILEAQVAEQLKAERYERTEERQGYRNGHRPRLLKTRVGELNLLRTGSFSTNLFERYQRSEQALTGHGGDGGQRGFNPEGSGDYGGVVRDGVFPVDRV